MRSHFIVPSLLFLSAAPPALAYETNDNWCDRGELGVVVDRTSFEDRGFTAIESDRAVRTALSWWSEAQAGLRFKYNSTTTSHGTGDPGPIYAACMSEDDHLTDNPSALAYTQVYRTWHPTCDFIGLNNDEWKIVVHSDAGPASCGTRSTWAVNVNEARQDGRDVLYEVLTHELGHVLGLGHEDSINPKPIMNSFVHDEMIITQDDMEGVMFGLGEGVDDRQLKTVRATRSGGALSFGAVTDLIPSRTAIWRPAVASNWNNNAPWDYVFAWVETNGRFLRLATGRDNSSGNLVMNPVIDPGDSTLAPIAVAVGASNSIGLAWVGNDDDRTINFKVSHDGGSTWTKTVLWGQSAIGGVSLSYHVNMNRWVMSWLRWDDKETQKYRIVTVVSNGSSGFSWTQTPRTYGDTLVMPNHTPVLTCERGDTNGCLLIYRSFASSDTRLVRQQAFELINGADDYLNAIPTTASTGDTAYSELAVAQASWGWILTYVWPTTANDKLTYRIKGFGQGLGGSFENPRNTWDGATSRSGFGVAVNRRTNAVRMVWKDN